MKRIAKSMLSFVLIGSVFVLTCTGCTIERKSPFFTMIETEYEDESAEAVWENFCEYVQNADFTEFDYAYSLGKDNYRAEDVTEIDAYRNEKNTVFCADTKEANYYYNKEDGVLHCDMNADGETSDLEGKRMEWSDFPFDETMEKAYDMLSCLCESESCLCPDYEKKALAYWGYQNRLSFSYSENNDETGEWEEKFVGCTPHSVSVFCNDDGTKFNCISITWCEGDMRHKVTWNSYDAILQSDRCVIRYEYNHGLREDHVPALDEQREQLKREMGDQPLYE